MSAGSPSRYASIQVFEFLIQDHSLLNHPKVRDHILGCISRAQRECQPFIPGPPQSDIGQNLYLTYSVLHAIIN